MRILLIVYTFVFLSFGLPIAAQVDFTWRPIKGCVPYEVRFAIDTGSVDISTISSAIWDFGNGEVITATYPTDTVSTIFNTQKATYTVKLTINNDASNSVSKFYTGTKDALISDFIVEKETDLADYSYTFTPRIGALKADAAYQFAWLYNKNGSYLGREVKFVDASNPERAIAHYTFADTGNYTIELTVRERNPDYNCESTTTKNLLIAEEFVVGNVFSPESSDYFIIDPEKADVILSFQLFSRTGLKVFEQVAPIIYWDGRNGSGQDLGTAVYFYVIEATQGDPTGDFYKKKGFIHVFR